MNYEILLTFFFGMLVLSATPGPGVFASVAKAVSDGFRSSLIFIGGLVIGDILFFSLALLGMTAISKLMGQLFLIIKIFGGLYLIYLGINTIRNRQARALSRKNNQRRYTSIISGLFVTLGNPKPILFYASIVPTIINIKEIHINEVLAIIVIITVVSYVVIGLYCYLATLSKSLMKNSRIQEKFNTMAGAVLISTGTYVILKKG
jgi:threonine/homoserine/homoserine lactone efflux protein